MTHFFNTQFLTALGGKLNLQKRSYTADEIFYCIKGAGFGVLEDGEEELTVGKVFIAPAGVMHSVRSDSEIYVTAFLVPVVK